MLQSYSEELHMKVIMVGASLEQNGGIATVEKLILKYSSSEVKIQHVTSHDEGTIVHRLIVFSKAIIQLAIILLCRKPDLIHIHLSDGGSLLRKTIVTLMVSLLRKPIIIHAHGAEFHTTYFRLPYWAQKLVSWGFQQCHSFIVLSNNWKEFYMHQVGLKAKQIMVLPNPTELPQEIPDRSQVSSVRFVFLGRVGNRKGTFDLIQAFARLPIEAQCRSQLLIAGDGDLEQAKTLVTHYQLTDRVTFLGWVNARQREAILSNADVFVLPSYNEGLPMSLLEAMSWGLSVIVTPVGGIPEVICSKQNGILVEAGDIAGLTEAMQTLIDHPQLRWTLGRSARATVEPYDIHAYCHRLTTLYGELTQSSES